MDWVLQALTNRLRTSLRDDRTRLSKPIVRLGRCIGGGLAGAFAGGMVSAQTAGELAVPDVFSMAANRPAPVDAGPEPLMADFKDIQDMPYMAPQSMPRAAYNIRIGNSGINFFAGLGITYTDNALMSIDGSGGTYDIFFNPNLGASFNWPIRDNQSLRFDLGVGYRKSINYPQFDAVTITPSSSMDYRFYVGGLMFTVFNTVSSASFPRSEIVGDGSSPADVVFNRIDNQTGVSTAWMINSTLALSSSYGYGISRSIGNDQFGILDMNSHNFSAALQKRLGPYWSVGLAANYSLSSFVERFQNDATSWSVGPMVSFRPSPYLSLFGTVRHSESTFSTSGVIEDTSEFSGLTFSAGINHSLTEVITHSITGGRSVGTGLGSNFTESLFASYGVGWQFSRKMGLNAGFSWNRFTQSGRFGTTIPVIVDGQVIDVPVTFTTSDEGDVYSYTLGTSYMISQKLNSNLTFSHVRQGSTRIQGRGFTSNMIGLNFGYTF